jgi:hypothetical protein
MAMKLVVPIIITGGTGSSDLPVSKDSKHIQLTL